VRRGQPAISPAPLPSMASPPHDQPPGRGSKASPSAGEWSLTAATEDTAGARQPFKPVSDGLRRGFRNELGTVAWTKSCRVD
jgi:hypothetical protein